MARRDQRVEVELVAARVLAQRIGGLGRVGERARIAAAVPVDAAIIDVPDGDATCPEVVGDPVHDPPVGDLGLPTTAMDHQHGRVRPFAFGEPQVDPLHVIGAIGNGRRRLGPRPLEQVRPGHQRT